MANLYGNDSEYLVRNKDISKFAAISWLVVLIGSIIFVINHPASNLFSLSNLMAIILTISPLLYFANLQLKKEKFRLFAFASGLKGEARVANELKNLTDSYVIFWDLKLPSKLSNIDFIVLGANVYLIEVKNYIGDIGYNGRELTCNGRLFKSNILKTAKAQAWSLSKYLESNIHKKIFVNPIIVFSNPHAQVKLGSKQIDGVYVVQISWLLKILTQYQPANIKYDHDLEKVLKNLLTSKLTTNHQYG